ncbi:Beta-galactosidase 16 [Capsicum baccatum]|uniref:Beta-galactosidase n=1 Tax=Capsicum baccatum TaxID=33114 RepID=A0A2G2WXT6_CAPBA|nr:Beta-galactosidase 16 [Capsicum baccatum]
MLRACALDFKGSWDDHLPLIEFAYNNSFHSSIGMGPFEALYERKCRSLIGWFEMGEAAVSIPDSVFEAMEKVKLIRESRIGKVADEVELPSELPSVHPIFHVSMLRVHISDTVVVDSSVSADIQENLSFDKIPVEILDFSVRTLRNKEVPLVKVLWRNQSVEGATWEVEADMRSKYPHLFSANSDQAEGELAALQRYSSLHSRYSHRNRFEDIFRGNFAKVKVEIDLLKPRLDQIWLGFNWFDDTDDGKWLDIEYDKIINDQINRHSNQIDPYKKNDKNKHTDDEINSRKDNDIHNNSNLHKYAIEPRNTHHNYLRLISGTSLEEDQANEDVFMGTHGHMSESSYEDDGAEPSSEDENHEYKMSSEEYDEFERLDSESYHSEDYLDNLDAQTTNDYATHLIGTFIPQTLVEVNISSKMDRIIHTTYFSPRGKERKRGDSESLKMMMKKLEAYENILGQLINKLKSDFYVSFEDGDPRISNISQITGFKQVMLVVLAVMVGIVVTIMMVVVDSDGGGCDVMLLNYDFSGRRDVVAFMKEIQAQGLYACLRMGPYIEAEWTYGGFPFWLQDVPGVVFRSNNEPFKFYMQNFTTMMVNLMKSEGLYASQGGPIILSQIENEYRNVEKAFRESGPPYVRWAAEMAVGLQTGVPWCMCKQDDAPDPLYHGGTNFGRTAAEYMITSYYDQAPLDEYGLIRQPKWGHLKELHEAMKLCSETILSVFPSMQSLGEQQEVSTQFNARTAIPAFKFDSAKKWEQFEEVIPQFDDTSLRSDILLEHMNTTKDVSDYLWYTSSIQQDSMEQQSTLSVKSLGHVLHAFVNGEHVGSAHGQFRKTSFTLESTVSLNKGKNNISLLSATVGLPNSGSFLERRTLGVESVITQDSKEAKDITNYSWGYQVGLLGEKLQLYSSEGSKSADWSNLGSSQPLTWYKSVFDAPKGDDPVALNLGSMGKGEAWVNGQSIGQYWVSFQTLAGIPSQTWYVKVTLI